MSWVALGKGRELWVAGIGVEEGFFDEMIFKLNLMEGQSCLVGAQLLIRVGFLV